VVQTAVSNWTDRRIAQTRGEGLRAICGGLPHNHQVRIHHRQGEQRAVHAIKEAAVAGEDAAAVFDAGAALQRRLGEVK